MKLLFYILLGLIIYSYYVNYYKKKTATSNDDNAVPQTAPNYPYLKKVQGGAITPIPEGGGITGYDSVPDSYISSYKCSTLNNILSAKK